MKRVDNLLLLANLGPAEKHLSILPIPVNIGSDNTDTGNAPAYFFKCKVGSALESAGFKVKILPKISALQNIQRNKKGKKNIKNIIKVSRDIIYAVKNEVKNNRKVLALGGDHMIAIGTIAGAASALKQPLGVIWVDAHGDMNTDKTSPSGNVHGMASALIRGLGDQRLTGLVEKKIKKDNILYLGLKDLDLPEIELIKKDKIKTVTMPDIIEYGFRKIKKEVDELRKRVSTIWVSLDVDSIDKQWAPASAMATHGSLTYREITSIFRYIGKTYRVVGMDIAEVTPKKDVDKKTAKLCIELAAFAFGSQYSWYDEYISHYKKYKK